MEILQLHSTFSAVLDILIRLARHSPASAQAIALCPHLLDVVWSFFVQQTQAGLATAGDGVRLAARQCRAKAVKLIRVMCLTGKTLSVSILGKYIYTDLIGYVINDDNSEAEVQLETLRLLHVCAQYGIFCDFFSLVYNNFMTRLRQLQNIPWSLAASEPLSIEPSTTVPSISSQTLSSQTLSSQTLSSQTLQLLAGTAVIHVLSALIRVAGFPVDADDTPNPHDVIDWALLQHVPELLLPCLDIWCTAPEKISLRTGHSPGQFARISLLASALNFMVMYWEREAMATALCSHVISTMSPVAQGHTDTLSMCLYYSFFFFFFL